jgi:hypothetical protein
MMLINKEILKEILEELEICATDPQIDQLSKDLSFYREDYNNIYGGITSKSNTCENCNKLKNEILEFKNEIKTYQTSVLKRRNANKVWVENGDVMYE